MKTLYISDLDGTLLHPNVELSSNSITIINNLIGQGMLFSVATARTIASVKPILKNITVSMPIVLMNGVAIYDLNESKYIKIEAFPKKSITSLMSIIQEYHLKGFAYTITNGVMATYYEELKTKGMQDFYQERVDRYQKKFIQVDDFTSLSDEPIIYFSLLDQRDYLEPIYHLLESIQDLNCVFYKDNYSLDLWYLEIYSKTASKFHAVQYLRSYLNLDSIVCFGDNRNDLPLFEASDKKIAVGNAVAELQAKADLIIGKNYEDGVANWLAKNFRILS
jgi:Cof subfamily protein (haloacid dehalogenase superfamily)